MVQFQSLFQVQVISIARDRACPVVKVNLTVIPKVIPTVILLARRLRPMPWVTFQRPPWHQGVPGDLREIPLILGPYSIAVLRPQLTALTHLNSGSSGYTAI